ncbi:hypothetical protein D3C74_218360 [compost metagenome]
MTREEIMSMEPGRELDRLVALKVMGYEPSKMEPKLVRKGAVAFLPEPYSWNISAAWEVVEKMKQNNWFFILSDNLFSDNWEASFFWEPNQEMVDSISKSAPEAICKAALLAVLAVLGEEE